MRLLLVAVVAIGLPRISAAQELKSIEISPFAGYFLGGTIFDERLPGLQNLSFANGLTYGVRVGWNVTSRIEPEFQWSRVESEFSPSASNRPPSLDVDYFLGGASYNFGSERTRPYVSVDFGAARIDAVDFVTDTLFTISVGAGVKYFATPNFGLRIDARGYTSMTNDHLKSVCTTFEPSGGVGGPVTPVPCAHSWLLNGDVTGGVIIAF